MKNRSSKKLEVPKEYMMLLLENQRLQNERKTIASDIHDDISGALHGIIKQLDLLKKRIDDPEIQRLVTDIKALTSDTLVSAKKLSHQIRPSLLDYVGLPAAIEEMVYDFSKHHKMQAYVQNFCSSLDEHDLKERLTDNQSENLYRIARESLNNIIKHANATEMSLSMRYKNNHLLIVLHDNGVGMRPGHVNASNHIKGGSGLLQMHARSQSADAQLSIKSRNGFGTSVRIRTHLPPSCVVEYLG